MEIMEPAKAARIIPADPTELPLPSKTIITRDTTSFATDEIPSTKGPAMVLAKNVWSRNPDTDSAIVPASALTGLEEAVRADLAEGTLGRRYLLENRDRLENCYYNDLYLEFRPAGRTGGEEEDGYTVCITLQSGARHTLAVLQACGLDGTLVTQAQIQKEDAVYAQSTTGRG